MILEELLSPLLIKILICIAIYSIFPFGFGYYFCKYRTLMDRQLVFNFKNKDPEFITGKEIPQFPENELVHEIKGIIPRKTNPASTQADGHR